MSINLTKRSYISELMDDPEVPQKLLYRNLHELDLFNRILGGHSLTLAGIKNIITDKTKIYHIADLGCGSGDAMKHMAKWAREKGYKIKFIGVDKSELVINYLKVHCKEYPEITGVACDYRDFLSSDISIDIIHCSLFCHHLTDNELEELFLLIKLHARTGFVINDLERNILAYYSAKIFIPLLFGSNLARNDGPLSVLRAFKIKELKTLLEKAQIKNFSIYRRYGYRLILIGQNNQDFN
jgi:2-polyprenyl-3-methyl-5-hydroxy-6-metoxy-1,4-benzoquinol methylase